MYSNVPGSSCSLRFTDKNNPCPFFASVCLYLAIIDIILALENFRIGLIEEGFFARGSIVKGEHFIKNDIMVSPAFIKAYEIEQNICIYPGIIIEESIAKELISNSLFQNDITYNKLSGKTIILDFDSNYIIFPFINYFMIHQENKNLIMQKKRKIKKMYMIMDAALA